jgi:hypothetical protein
MIMMIMMMMMMMCGAATAVICERVRRDGIKKILTGKDVERKKITELKYFEI